MFDLSCFGIISALQIFRVGLYPSANSGCLVSETFGFITPDAPIVALLAAHLGLNVGLVSHEVGDDSAGKQLVDVLSAYSVRSTVSLSKDSITPQTIVISDDQENRTWFSYLPHVAERLLDADLGFLKESHLAYVDFYKIICEASLRAVQYAVQHQIPLFINLGGDSPSSEAILLLREAKVAVVQTSLDMASPEQAKRYIEELRDTFKSSIIIVTLSKNGCVCATLSDMIHVPAYQLNTIHSNGAGAAFSAGFAYAYTKKWTLEQSLLFASAFGGLYCTTRSGIGEFTSTDILNLVAEQRREERPLTNR